MPGKKPCYVLDTSLLIALFLKETGRVYRSREVLTSDADLVLPSLAVLEILANPKLRVAHNPAQAPRLQASQVLREQLYNLNLRIFELSERVVDIASGIIPKCNIKAPDAVIVATGIAVGADKVYAWDEKLISACQSISDRIEVCEPPQVAQLPLFV